MPDFVGDRYYSSTARVVAAIAAIFVSMTYVAGQMRGVGYARYGATVRLSRDESRFSGPRNLGADTDAILAELGYDGARIEILRRDGVVGGSA